MPTDKPRVTFALEQDMLDAIDDYKFKNRIKNQSQAIISLIERGFSSLHDDSPKTEKSPASEDAEDFISMEESNRLFDSLVEAGLIQDTVDFSPNDRAFLTHVIGLLETWISNKRA